MDLRIAVSKIQGEDMSRKRRYKDKLHYRELKEHSKPNRSGKIIPVKTDDAFWQAWNFDQKSMVKCGYRLVKDENGWRAFRWVEAR